jgi:hypothetical protein
VKSGCIASKTAGERDFETVGSGHGTTNPADAKDAFPSFAVADA